MMTVLTEETSKSSKKGRAGRRRAERAEAPGSVAAAELVASGALDELFAQIDAGQVELAGDGGFIPGLIKAASERGLQAELTDHLGYEKGDPQAAFFDNSRNGTTPKTVTSQVGDLDLAVPRDRNGTFCPQLVPKGARRLGGVDDMIIGLYAGGMTVRDISHFLASTIGTELSHETISKLLWLAICNIEDKRAWERAAEAGPPAGQRKAPGRLVEGQVVTNWKQALAQLALGYPERINQHP